MARTQLCRIALIGLVTAAIGLGALQMALYPPPAFSEQVAEADSAPVAGEDATLSGAELADEQEVAELVEQLGDRSFVRREAAQDRLERMGHTVLPLLERHRDHPDAEVATRVRAIFEAHVWTQRGALIFRLEPGSQAVRLGLRPGEVVLRINRNDVESINEIRAVPDTTERDLIVLGADGMRRVTVGPGRIGIWLSNWREDVGGREQLRAIRLLDDPDQWAEARRLFESAVARGVNDTWTSAALAGLAAYALDHGAAVRAWGPLASSRLRGTGWEDVIDHQQRGLPLGGIAIGDVVGRLEDQPNNHQLRDDAIALATFIEPNRRLARRLGDRLPRDPRAGTPSRAFQADAARAWVRLAAFDGDYAEALDVYRQYAGGMSELTGDVMHSAIHADRTYAASLAGFLGMQRRPNLADEAVMSSWALYAAAQAAMQPRRDGQLNFLPVDVRMVGQARAVEPEMADHVLRYPAVAWMFHAIFERSEPGERDSEQLEMFGPSLQIFAAVLEANDRDLVRPFVDRLLESDRRWSDAEVAAAAVLLVRLGRWEALETWLQRPAIKDRVPESWAGQVETLKRLNQARDPRTPRQGIVKVKLDADGDGWAVAWDGAVYPVKGNEISGEAIRPAGKPWRINPWEARSQSLEDGVAVWLADRPGDQPMTWSRRSGQWRLMRPDELAEDADDGLVAAVLSADLARAGREEAEAMPFRLTLEPLASGWWWSRWEGELAIAVHPADRRAVAVHDALRRQLNEDAPEVFAPSVFQDGRLILVPSERGLWRFDSASGELDRVRLDDEGDRRPVRIMTWPRRAGKIHVGECPSVSGRILELAMDRLDAGATVTGGYNGEGCNDIFLDLREQLYRQRIIRLFESGGVPER